MNDARRQGILALLLLSSAIFAVPELIRLTRLATIVGKLDYEERRLYMGGEFYRSLLAVDDALHPDEGVAIAMKRVRDVDRGIFVNYYAYPRRTRFYFDLDGYRHDDSPRRPATLWYIDLDRTHEVREMTYDEIRVEQSRDESPISPMEAFQRFDAGEWIVPLVAFADGGGRDRFATEALFLADTSTEINGQLQGTGEHCVLALRKGEPLRVSNLMAHCFGAMGSGWMRLTADSSVSTGFWLVNRGTGVHAAVHAFQDLPAAPFLLKGGEKIWLINPHVDSLKVDVNGELHELLPLSTTVRSNAEPMLRIDATRPLIAFSSSKEPDGNTLFAWPERLE